MSDKDDLDEFGIGGVERVDVSSRPNPDIVGSSAMFHPDPPTNFILGQYEVEIERVSATKGRNGQNIFVVETKVLKSNNPRLPPGAAPSWVQNLDSISSPIKVKEFLAQAFGTSIENVTEHVYNQAVSTKQPLRDERLSVRATAATTKTGKSFTRITWTRP